jgi:LacI family transcriptional regulator
MPEIPTLRDVAAAAGVSKSTAQRALANDPRCSARTREIVQRVAAEIKYVPDPLFAAVGTRRRTRKVHGTPIAYLVALSEGKQEGGAKYFPWCQERAAELGYRLELIDIAQLEAPKRLWQMLYARGFAGALIGSVRSKFHPLLMENNQFPAVCAGRIDHLPYHTARPAIQLGVRRVWDEMIKLGYRRIGAAIFQHNPPLEDDFSRFSAVVGLQMIDLPHEIPIPPLTSDFNDLTKFMPWVEQHKPDAIIAFHDGLLFDLRDAGIKVPRDMGFASLHLDEKTDPSISGICENNRLVAISSVNFLDQMIRHGERGLPEAPINLMIEGTWIPGKTLCSQIKKPKRAIS